MIESASIATAFMIGLLGGVHCVGMCGGIVHALSFAIAENKQPWYSRFAVLWFYNSGRILTYTVIGAMFGGLGWLVQDNISAAAVILRLIAGLMLVSMGLYLTGWWRGLAQLEKMAGYLWHYLQPFAQSLMPVENLWQALLLGFIWGWLPCGLVYSALVFAFAQGHWHQSAMVMLSFGLGTLPVMLMTGALALRFKTWVQHYAIRNIAGISIILFGVWTMTTPLLHGLDKLYFDSAYSSSHDRDTSIDRVGK